MTELRGEEGYATLAVVGFLSVLAITAVALLRLASSEADLTRAAAEQIEADLLVDAVWTDVINEVLQGTLAPSMLSSLRSKNLSGQSFTYRASDESQKISLPRASESELLGLLDACRTSPLDVIGLRVGLTAEETLEVLYSQSSISAKSLCCLRQRSTPFLPSTPAVMSGRMQGSKVSDGALIRVEITSNHPAPYTSLDIAAIVTGRPNDPIWVLDWRRGTLPRNHFEVCQ